MKVKFDYISEIVGQLYFGFSVEEIDFMFLKAREKGLSKDEIIIDIKEEIEEFMIEEELEKLGIISIGPKFMKYYSDIKLGKPLLGVVKFYLLPDNIDFSLPSFIPDEVYEGFYNEFSFEDEKLINKILFSNGFFDVKNTDIVTNSSIVTYDLMYVKDDVILNTISDQIVDASTDLPFFVDKLIGKKKNSKFTIDKNKDVKTMVKIKKIETRVPFELTDELVRELKLGSIKSKNAFLKKVKEATDFQRDVNIAIVFISEAMYQSDQIEIDEVMKKAICENLDEFEVDEEEMIKNFRRMLILEYLEKIVELKDDVQTSQELEKKIQSTSQILFLASGRKSEMSSAYVIEDLKNHARLLDYFKQTNLVNNIRL